MIGEALRGFRAVVHENVPLSGKTTLRVGGPARFFAELHDAASLAALLRAARAERLPILALGKGSNLLVPDAGFPGVVFTLAGDFLAARIEAPEVVAGGGMSLMSLAVVTQRAGLSGLENLSGIPSSLGGAVRINAGSYGSELFDVLVSVDVVSEKGDRRTTLASEIPHGYRWTAFCDTGEIVCGATLKLVPKPADEIGARLAEVAAKRRHALPKQPNAGSIFKNPPGLFAGKLLEECGLKGRRVGGAEISPVHANVIVNLGGATAADVEALMNEMETAVKEKFGIELVPEIQVLGETAGRRGPSVDTAFDEG
ncbi:MAG: UDP-N-acetylmuramate dehydrogenase [Thermoanaerobaculia bacterium]